MGSTESSAVHPEQLLFDPNGLPGTISVIEPTCPEMEVVSEMSGKQQLFVIYVKYDLKPGDKFKLLPPLRASGRNDHQND